MASWGTCEFRALRELNERVKQAATEAEMDGFYTGLLDDMAGGLIKMVVRETPCKTHQLQHGWLRTKAVRRGKNYEAEIYNNVEYASWVENGHRTRLNKKTGERHWVEGVHMLRKSVFAYQRAAPAYIKKKTEEFLRGMMEAGQ